MTNPVANYYFRTETNQRSNNEDSGDRSEFSIPNAAPITLLSLADGMGGYAHGEDISTEGLRQFKLALGEKLQSIAASSPLTLDRLKQAMLDALQQANALVSQLVAANNWHKAGSTLVAAAIWQERLVVTNLGDSPLFHYVAATGELVKVTLDHSVVGILAQAGIITEEMARHHERRGQLEYYLGGERIPNPLPVYERELRSGDLVMLCSDGINGLLSTEQIRQILARGNTSLEQKVDELIIAARAAGETDNQTLMLWCHSSQSEIPLARAHKQPDRAQDLKTLDARSPRGRAIERQLSNSAEPPSQERKQQAIAPHKLLWALCGSVITIAAVSIAGWDTTKATIESLPRHVNRLLNGPPKVAPTQSNPEPEPTIAPKKAVPPQLPPEREPIEIVQPLVNWVK